MVTCNISLLNVPKFTWLLYWLLYDIYISQFPILFFMTYANNGVNNHGIIIHSAKNVITNLIVKTPRKFLKYIT